MYKIKKIWYNDIWILKGGKTLDNINSLPVMAECEACKHRFQLSSDEGDTVKSYVNHKKEFNVNGKSIFLTYYDCPSCGRRHYVQIDDTISLDKLKEVQMMFIKLSVMKNKGKKISKKQSDKFKKARQNLSDYRMKLIKEYTGKLIRNNETESDFELRFSI